MLCLGVEAHQDEFSEAGVVLVHRLDAVSRAERLFHAMCVCVCVRVRVRVREREREEKERREREREKEESC